MMVEKGIKGRVQLLDELNKLMKYSTTPINPTH